MVDNDDDCDDSDAQINPNQQEICGDEKDNNCDGSGAGCGLAGEIDISSAWFIANGINKDDNAGIVVAGHGDVNGDGIPDALIAAPSWDLNSDTLGTGAVYIVYGGREGGSISLSEADATYTGIVKYDAAGTSATISGDVNGDGIDDLVVSSPYAENDPNQLSSGTVSVVYGPLAGQHSLSEADVQIWGEAGGDNLAFATSLVGDIDGDGFGDLVISSVSHDSPSTDGGRVYLFYGPLTGKFSASEADATFDGSASFDKAGYSVAAAGDLNKDGMTDLIIGAPEYGDAGGAFCFLAPFSGHYSLSDADFSLTSTEAGAAFGRVVANAGDVNNDGNPDLMVSAPFSDEGGQEDAGAVYLFLGPITESRSTAEADASMYGEGLSDQAGYSAAPAGDLNNDGYDDLLIGAISDESSRVQLNAAYIEYGPLTGPYSLSQAGARIFSQEPYRVGRSVSGLGDFDDDGYDDIIVGVPDRVDDNDSNGSAHIFRGQSAL
jgi:hypothetical protein